MKKKKSEKKKGRLLPRHWLRLGIYSLFFFFVVVVVVLCTYKRPFTVRGNRQKKKENEKK